MITTTTKKPFLAWKPLSYITGELLWLQLPSWSTSHCQTKGKVITVGFSYLVMSQHQIFKLFFFQLELFSSHRRAAPPRAVKTQFPVKLQARTESGMFSSAKDNFGLLSQSSVTHRARASLSSKKACLVTWNERFLRKIPAAAQPRGCSDEVQSAGARGSVAIAAGEQQGTGIK